MVLVKDVTGGVGRVEVYAVLGGKTNDARALGLEERASRASMTKECSYQTARFGRNRSERRRVEV